MEVKIVLTFTLLGCFWLADGCSRGSSSSRPTDYYLRRQKRSIERKTYYSLKLQTAPCNFDTYDDDMDGVITKSELHTTLRNDEETDALFADLDETTDDGVITRDEFYEMAPLTIMECFNSDK